MGTNSKEFSDCSRMGSIYGLTSTAERFPSVAENRDLWFCAMNSLDKATECKLTTSSKPLHSAAGWSSALIFAGYLLMFMELEMKSICPLVKNKSTCV